MFDFAIIGGDMRQKYLCQILLELGFSIITCGLYVDFSHSHLKQTGCLKEAVCSAKTIIGPIPLTRDKRTVLQTVTPSDTKIPAGCYSLTAASCKSAISGCQEMDFAVPILLNEFTSYLSPSKTLIAGCIPDSFHSVCHCTDLMESEELTLFNSIATAEGVIAEAILNWPRNIHQASCLVLGYGRCAKALANRLLGLHSNVSVAARSKPALSAALADGMGTVSWNDLPEQIARFDLIFNTVPAIVLTAPLLKKLKNGAAIFDLASTPGGIDKKKADELNISFWSCPGLPGRYAPQASAQEIAKFIIEGTDFFGIKK